MEASLSARVRAGDPTAFVQLYEQHAHGVYVYALRLTGDWSAAEDAMSLTFLEAWRLRGRVEADRESLRPWLYGIATNVVRNLRRSVRRHRDALAQLPLAGTVPDFADELVGRIEDTRRLHTALAALQRLKPAEREVFALCVWEGMDHAAVAEALGLRVGSVRSRLSRARKRLRELVDEDPAVRTGELQRPDRIGQVGGGRASAAGRDKEKNR